MQQPIIFQKKERKSSATSPPGQYLPQSLNTTGWMKSLTAQPKLLQQLLMKYDSPLNIHNVRYFKENCKSFEDLLNNYHVKNQVTFTRKINPNQVYLRTAEQSGIGVDATDYQELKECLEAGIDPEKLVVTGANKSEKLLCLAINYNVLIMMESPDECELLHAVAEERGKRAKVGFRVRSFAIEDKNYNSESGFDIEKIDEFIIKHFSYTGGCVMLEYEGLFLDMDGSVEEKGNALHLCLDLSERLCKYGLKTKFIGIKGDMDVRCPQAIQKSWRFDKVLSKTMNGKCKSVDQAKNRTSFGFFDTKKLQPFKENESKTDFLKKVLEYKRDKAGTAANRLLEKSILLNIALGGSLLDQCAFTVCRVASQRKDDSRNIFIGVEMNKPSSLQCNKIIATTPFVVAHNQNKKTTSVDVFLTSAYGIDQEFLLPYKIRMNQYPEVGDLLIFFNTAADTTCFLKPSVNDLSDLSRNLVYTENKHQFTFSEFREDKTID
jgi:diaminopimelate decarboxylase